MRLVIVFLVLVSAGCNPGLFDERASCRVDGFVLHQAWPRDCSVYADFIAQDWDLVTSSGWVSPDSKDQYRGVEIWVWDNWSIVCGNDSAGGCYYSGDHIETDETLGALSHEWLHHLDYVNGVPHEEDAAHVGWADAGWTEATRELSVHQLGTFMESAHH